MIISKLEVEGVKRIRVAEITPGGALVRIRGRNGQGKTSVLDAISYALGGADLCPAEPIRRGETKARVLVELDDGMVAERTFTAGGTRLEVRSKDGLKYPKPQQVLDKIIGKLSFDPMAFMRLKPREQAETLRAVAGIDLSEIEERRRAAFEDRTVANRRVKQIEARLAAMPAVDAPDEPVSAADLMEEHQVRCDAHTANNLLRDDLTKVVQNYNAADGRVESIEREIADLKRQIERLELNLAQAIGTREGIASDGRNLKAKVNALVDPDLQEIPAKLREVEEINRRVAAKKARAELASELDAAAAEHDEMDDTVAAMDSAKAAILRDARFPVPGLGFAEAGVTLDGIPLGQASSAEQLRVSLAMGLALNPSLRVVFVRDGSLLDEDSLALVAEMAEAAQAQVWCEIVGKGGEGIVIEDGLVELAPAEASA